MPQAVEPNTHTVDNNATPVTHTAAYAADIDSLKSLELSSERDEINWFSKINSLQLAKDDDVDVTAIIYGETEDMDLGELAFEEYKTDVDEQSIKAIHQAKGDTFLFKGKAYVQNNPVKVLVFREK